MKIDFWAFAFWGYIVGGTLFFVAGLSTPAIISFIFAILAKIEMIIEILKDKENKND